MTTLNLAAFCGQHDIRGWMKQPIIGDDLDNAIDAALAKDGA